VRISPLVTPVMDQTASLMDPSRRLVFVASFHPARHVIFGYVFRREEYPWLQIWDSYPGEGRASSRGMEFATEPFDLPRAVFSDSHSSLVSPEWCRSLPAQDQLQLRHVLYAHAGRIPRSTTSLRTASCR
jgi:hypothetical protein